MINRNISIYKMIKTFQWYINNQPKAFLSNVKVANLNIVNAWWEKRDFLHISELVKFIRVMSSFLKGLYLSNGILLKIDYTTLIIRRS